jgi:hypothetical protein
MNKHEEYESLSRPSRSSATIVIQTSVGPDSGISAISNVIDSNPDPSYAGVEDRSDTGIKLVGQSMEPSQWQATNGSEQCAPQPCS